MRALVRSCIVLLGLAAGAAATAGVVLEPKPAPDWKVSEWINGSGGQLADHRGQVILIQFFQLWCPACNDFSIPLFNRWNEEFGSRDDVVVLSIHTVFEAHELQTPLMLRTFVAQKGMVHPVGIDAYEHVGDAVPITMDRFDTGGTPHVVIIDQQGKLRFSHFGRFDPVPVERFITRLLDDKAKVGTSTTRDDSNPYDKKSSRRRSPPPTPPRATPKPPRVEEELVGDAAQDEGEGEAEAEGEEEDPGKELSKDLSGSYKLRFETLAQSCGDIGQPIEVITQVSVYRSQVVAKFSRAYLGIRMLNVDYDSSAGQMHASVQQSGQEKGGVSVDLSLQLTGRILVVSDEPEIEFEYYVDKRSEDGRFDCVIEGRGTGTRFRSR